MITAKYTPGATMNLKHPTITATEDVFHRHMYGEDQTWAPVGVAMAMVAAALGAKPDQDEPLPPDWFRYMNGRHKAYCAMHRQHPCELTARGLQIWSTLVAELGVYLRWVKP